MLGSLWSVVLLRLVAKCDDIRSCKSYFLSGGFEVCVWVGVGRCQGCVGLRVTAAELLHAC